MMTVLPVIPQIGSITSKRVLYDSTAPQEERRWGKRKGRDLSDLDTNIFSPDVAETSTSIC